MAANQYAVSKARNPKMTQQALGCFGIRTVVVESYSARRLFPILTGEECDPTAKITIVLSIFEAKSFIQFGP